MGSVLPFLALTDQERQVLEGYCRKGTTEHRLVQRAEVILAVATGTAYRAVAREVGQARNTVRKWSRRFAADRLAGVQDRPRAGRPPIFSTAARTQIVGLACRAPGDEGCTNDDRWTLDLLVEAALRQGICRRFIGRPSLGSWSRGRLSPIAGGFVAPLQGPGFSKRRSTTSSRSTSSRQWRRSFSASMRRRASKRSIASTRISCPLQDVSGRREFEYIRHGTLTPLRLPGGARRAGLRVGAPARGRVEFLTFMDQLAARYPTGHVRCVPDNLNTHLGPEVDAWLTAHDHRFVFHFTPIHASCVNQIEVWFSILSRKLLRGASFSTLDDLEARNTTFIADYNSRASPFKWTWKGYPLVA